MLTRTEPDSIDDDDEFECLITANQACYYGVYL